MAFANLNTLKYLLCWTGIALVIGIITGSLVALFLWLLGWATHFRFTHPWLLYLLPVAGMGIHFLYKWYGGTTARGNDLVIDEIHQPGAGIPKRMAPLILAATVITHLFGGSAGREGTAVQIGGSLANLVASSFKLTATDRQLALTAGIAAGFGAVFGTPFTATIFALEVLTIGRIKYNALLPCLVAGLVGDATVSAWGVLHTPYHIDTVQTDMIIYGRHITFDPILLLKIMIASAIFGLAAYAFAKAVHGIKFVCNKFIKSGWLIPVIGGLVVILLTISMGRTDYLGLGVDAEYPGTVTITSSFTAGGAHFFSWFWKLVYTSITLGTGFKGGEVTPLFYIGSTLGNTLAGLLNAPVSLFAGLGFIAVFAGATNTPLACTIMGIELFGSEYAILYAIACFTAYYFSGNTGIYSAQRWKGTKLG